jgi:hypothetical protein
MASVSTCKSLYVVAVDVVVMLVVGLLLVYLYETYAVYRQLQKRIAFMSETNRRDLNRKNWLPPSTTARKIMRKADWEEKLKRLRDQVGVIPFLCDVR